MYTSLGASVGWQPPRSAFELPDYPRRTDGSIDTTQFGARDSWNPREVKAKNIGFVAGLVLGAGAVVAVIVFKATAKKP